MFHHFADNYEMIKLIHEKYMHTQHENNFESKIQKDIPLLLLSPDDKNKTVASEIAIKK